MIKKKGCERIFSIIIITYSLGKIVISSKTNFLFLEKSANSLAAGVGISTNSGVVAPAKIDF